MEMINEIGSSGNKSPVLTDVVKKFFEQFMPQTDNKHELPIELTNKTGTKLHDLNEDCLLEIFSVESLSIYDLCLLAETCSRFQRIVRRVFPKKLKFYVSYDEKMYIEWKGKPRKAMSDRLIDKILRNCESTLCEIELCDFNDCTTTNVRCAFILNLLSKYCVERLESSGINCMITPDVSTVKSKTIFNRLQVLHLVNVKIGGFDSFADFDSLIELKVSSVKDCDSILETIFPKLERFSILWGKINEFLLQPFISRHPKLKRLILRTRITENFQSCILQEIGKSCCELEELSLECDYNLRTYCLLPLQSLKRLETLRVYDGWIEDLSFVPAMTNLRELVLCSCNPLEVNQLAYLTQLTKLCITGRCHLDVTDVAKLLTNLERLEIKNKYLTLNEYENTFRNC